MRFGVLGPLAVWTDDGTPVTVPDAKVRALLADLLTQPGRPASTDRLIDDLWGDRAPRNPLGTLQARVSQLRRALEDAEPGGRGLLVSRAPGYVLDVQPDALDASRFQALVAQAREQQDPRTRASLLADALDLWRGPAYADFADDEFARTEIGRLDEQRLAALEDQAEARLELGEHVPLAGQLADLVAAYPLRERLRAAYMQALYLAGRPSEALDSYAELRDRLRDEMGLDPGAELAALQQAILRQDPTLTPRTTRSRAPRLPAALTDLIGRAAAVSEVSALLKTGRRGGPRLVTLTGPGGVGKTRLAIEAATRVADVFPDGVWLAELAALPPGSGEVAELVAAELGIRDETDGGSAERLAAALEARHTLVVLDNCEHVIDEAAALAERLLKAAPELRILTTSQEPLGLAGEHVLAVPPLEEDAAVRLFVARAEASAPGFTFTPDDEPHVAAIVRRLDGIPLALELAATRVRALGGVRELAARLDDRFRLLTAGQRGAPARQQTLRAVIDWSWGLLSEQERIVLRRLAVFADGCALDAAEEVCDGPDVLDVLARLVDRSLVVAANGRYRLLESVAAYAAERLREAGEEREIRARHIAHYLALAERADLRGLGQCPWLRKLDHEVANFRTALDNADAHQALRLANALAWYFYLRGRFHEARRFLTFALAVEGEAPAAVRAAAVTWQAGMTMQLGEGADSAELAETALRAYDGVDDPHGRARAEWFLSLVTWAYSDFGATEERLEGVLDTFTTYDDQWGVAATLSLRATLAVARADLPMMEGDGERSLALFRELGDSWGMLSANDALDRVAEVTGDYDRAVELREEGVRQAEELGMWAEVSYRLSGLGRLAMLTRDLERARELHERARTLAVKHSSKSAEEFAEVGLGLVARRDGRLGDAESHLRTWLGWLGRVGGQSGTAFVKAELGFVAELRGDAETALALHREGYAEAYATRDPRAVALALEGLAGATVLAGRAAEGARLLGTAAAARASVGAPLPTAERGDVDRVTAAAHKALGEDDFAAAFAEGQAMAPEDHAIA
ncbi:winged helix-turn-helix domain-containing protein [Actinomadura barringtoniae]|uniref:Winged helix-turn-helix domain-containing protein n=1 Tax=Actinomadura barringtoniae TaxID=1427535 RepID=A0A939TE59_9ACTN|nr:BTAD domain-containing putative transcriptional regulator [Actinomadura barringtoniae]MBO2453010.1 winged helix-turn-helix domain-containing protein [Actinomadura barringtoniae]